MEKNINEEYLISVIEGLLFISGDEGITSKQLSEIIEVSIEEIENLFNKLQEYYLDDKRGIELVNYGGVYKFLSKSFVHDFAKKLFQTTKQNTLSQSALETLAIIAYKQPITRVEIEEIRGVGVDMMLRKLIARNLIKESGRSDSAGRPILYEVTDEFMDTFKLLSLDELPELANFEMEIENESLFD